MMHPKKILSVLAKRSLEVLLNRRLILFPRVYNPPGLARYGKARLLPLRYTYRASDNGVVSYEIIRGGSDFRYALFTMEFEARLPKAGPRRCGIRLPMIKAGDRLMVSLTEAKAWLNGTPMECVVESEEHSRKFVARAQLMNE
jgi:hypothetical protein